MATLLKVLNNLADIKSAGGVALRVRTQGRLQIEPAHEISVLHAPNRSYWSDNVGALIGSIRRLKTFGMR